MTWRWNGVRSRATAAMAAPASGYAWGALSVGLFAGFTLVSRSGLVSSLKPWDLAALRFGIGGVLLLPVLLRHGLANVAPRQALALAFTGGIGFAACAYAGFALAPATHGAVLLHGTLPLSTYAVARATGVATAPRRAGLPLIALGVAAMAIGAAGGGVSQWLGDGALLLASCSWSAYGLLAQRLQLRSAHSASIVAVLSMVMMLPPFLALSAHRTFAATWHEWLFQAVFQGMAIGVVSIYVYSRALARLGAERTALLTSAVPCVTTLGAMAWLHESPPWPVVAGVGLVTTGMLVSLAWKRREPTPKLQRTASASIRDRTRS